MEIVKGYITLTSEGGKRAQVETVGGKIYDDVLMLYPYGDCSNIQSDDSSLIMLFKSMGDDTNIVGMPYNVPLQPELELTEKATGNFKIGNKITFKANGDIEVIATNDLNITTTGNTSLTTTGETNIDSTGNTNITGALVNVADAIDLVLNQSATMTVTVPGGSSAGTYPVVIVSPGQTKVSA